MNWPKECNDLFVKEDNLSIKRPNKMSFQNLKKGLEIFKTLGKIGKTGERFSADRVFKQGQR